MDNYLKKPQPYIASTFVLFTKLWNAKVQNRRQ